MMIRSDFHTHTTFCDGKNTAQEMAAAALQKGMTALGFSGHVYLPEGTEWCMSRENMELYRREIARLQEQYAGKLRIARGVEQDFYAPVPEGDWDYVIASVHYFEKNGVLADVDRTAALQRQAVSSALGLPNDYAPDVTEELIKKLLLELLAREGGS